MKRVLKWMLALSMLLCGCSSEKKNEIKVSVVDLEGEVIAEKEITYDDDDTLVSLVEENFDNVLIQDGMIYDIESLETPEDWSDYICIYTDGEMSQVGIEEIELTNDLEVSFEMTPMQLGEIYVSVVDIDGNVIDDQTIAYYSGDTLVSVVEANFDNVTIEDGMIYTIDTLETPEDWSQFICIYTNGEMSQVGIEDITLENNLEVSFEMTEMSY